MLKSLWSGVTGLQAHQIAMDVESNNISNVNTVGFKYSRANFADLMSQTKRIATAPQGDLGGQNDLSIGLGTSINSTTKIFLQGSMQSTDKNTDLALQGDGFFVLSPDGGVTQRYSRSGDFVFDANGSLVDNNGYIVQGWTKEIRNSDEDCASEDTFTKVDSTGPVSGIQIDPGLVLPAKKSSQITLRANLSAGDTVEQFDCARQLDSDGTNNVTTSANQQYDSNGKIIEVSEDMGVLFNSSGEAFNLSSGQGIWISYKTSQVDMDITALAAGSITLNGTSFTYDGSGVANLIDTINTKTTDTGIEASLYTTGGVQYLRLTNDNDYDTRPRNIILGANTTGAVASDTTTMITAFKYEYTTTDVSVTDVYDTNPNNARSFKTTEDIRALMQRDANMVKDSASVYPTGASVKVTLNNKGQFEIENGDDGDATSEDLKMAISAISDSTVSRNELFTTTMEALGTAGLISEGGSVNATSDNINAAIHAASTDVFDSLGTKHTVRMEFRKTSASEWTFRVVVPEPGKLVGAPTNKSNVFEDGVIKFNSDGSLSGFSPPSIQYDPNNGAKAPQLIRLSMGTPGYFDGLTSVDQKSSTGNIAQNGYASGDLLGLRVDSTGTVLGSFSNGKTVALAQVAVAKFANNAGLLSEGGNLFSVSANSGDPIIGTAGSGGRADVAASMLEMSNVDLSRSLTQLIVVQRGFQANSKTVTTSDQMLNTLLQLKQ